MASMVQITSLIIQSKQWFRAKWIFVILAFKPLMTLRVFEMPIL